MKKQSAKQKENFPEGGTSLRGNFTEGIVTRFIAAFDLVCAESRQPAHVIAQSLGISGAIVSKMRKGINQSIRADYIASICAIYGFSVLWVMTGEGEQRSTGQMATIREQIERLQASVNKVIKLQDDVISPLINEMIGVKVGPVDVKNKLIDDLKKSVHLKS